MKIAHYDTDVSDAQWKLLEKELPTLSKMGRPPTDRRIILMPFSVFSRVGFNGVYFLNPFPLGRRSAIFSVNGPVITLWKDLMVCSETRFGHKQTSDGSLRRPFLTVKVSNPTLMEGKLAMMQAKGRKRHILVDTVGLLLGVAITTADMPERAGARTLLSRILKTYTWLRKMWVDGGYTGPEFAQWVKGQRPNLEVDVVKRSDEVNGFEVLPRRWVVERTFG